MIGNTSRPNHNVQRMPRRASPGHPLSLVLVVGGLVLGFVPGLPAVRLDSNLVFLVFLSCRGIGELRVSS